MENNKSRWKIWKWIGGFVLVLLLAIAGVAIYLASEWKPIVTKKIKETVLNSTDGLYRIDFEDMSMNLFTGNVSFRNIVFTPDSTVYRKLQQQGIAPENTFRVELAGLILNRANPWKVYFSKKLEMNSIVIDSPAIHVFYDNYRTKEDTVTDKRTAYQRLSKTLKSIAIRDIILQNVNFKYTDRSKKPDRTSGFKGMQIKVTDLLIDSAAQFDKSRFYYTKDIFVQVKDHKMVTSDGMYTIKLGELSSSTQSKYIRFDKIQMIPNYPELAFSYKYKYQHDRYNIRADEVLLYGIDFEKLNRRRKIFASSMTVTGAIASVFLNRDLPRPPGDKVRNFPHVALRKLEPDTWIDTLEIKDARVSYTEYNPKDKRKDTLFFTNMKGTFRNVSSDSLALLKNPWCYGHASARLMGKGALTLNLKFNLRDPNYAFTYSGTIGKMDLRILNPVAKPLAMVEVTSGNISGGSFSATGSPRGTNGTLKLHYTDLKIGVLKVEEGTNQLKKQGVISILANVMVVKNNNPEPDEPFRTGKMTFVRPPYSSFFNLMWNGIFSGLKETIGLTPEMQQKLVEKAAKSNEKDQKKEAKKERREERKRKRAERRAKEEAD